MQPEEITDRDSLEAWLKTRSQEECIRIANRSAARVMPLWAKEIKTKSARKRAMTSLLFLRPIIISRAVSTYPISKIEIPAATAFDAAAASAASASASAAGYAASAAGYAASAASAAGYAASTADYAASAADDYASDYSFAYSSASIIFWMMTGRDCSLLDEGKPLEGVRLWHEMPNFLEAEWQATRAEWQAPDSPYRFWLRWYEAALQGRHLNLDLEHDIALIPSEDWEKGPDHIATLIDALEERHDLKAQVTALRDQLCELKQQSASVAHRSHNQPPELVDAPTTLNRHVTVVVAALDEAEAELKKPTPDPSALVRLGNRLIEAAVWLTKYCGTLADAGLKKAAEELGTTVTKWSVRALVVNHLAMSEPVQTLGQALFSYAQKILTGG